MCGHVQTDPVVQGLREEALSLDIGEPSTTGLGLGERNAVTELDLLAYVFGFFTRLKVVRESTE